MAVSPLNGMNIRWRGDLVFEMEVKVGIEEVDKVLVGEPDGLGGEVPFSCGCGEGCGDAEVRVCLGEGGVGGGDDGEAAIGVEGADELEEGSGGGCDDFVDGGEADAEGGEGDEFEADVVAVEVAVPGGVEAESMVSSDLVDFHAWGGGGSGEGDGLAFFSQDDDGKVPRLVLLGCGVYGACLHEAVGDPVDEVSSAEDEAVAGGGDVGEDAG